MPGPKPKYSKEDRAAQGNPGRRPEDVKNHADYVDFFPEGPTDSPPPPAFLMSNSTSVVNQGAIEIWNYLAGYVFSAKLYRDGDAAALGRLCRYLSEWDLLTQILDAEGFISAGPRGPQRHPALMARNGIEAHIQKLESQFGLNPDDRLKLAKGFANSLDNLPLAGKSKNKEDDKGPVGFLTNG